MGNKMQSRRESEDVIVFPPAPTSGSSSVTIPSLCTSPSYHIAARKSASDTSSEGFNWAQMQALYLQQEDFAIEQLSPVTLKGASAVFEILKRQLGDLCADMHNGTVKMPEGLIEKFVTTSMLKLQVSSVSTMSNQPLVVRKMIVHIVTVLYVHDMILNFLRLRDRDGALDLIKQIAVSHALRGITTQHFRLMDWFLIHYLIKFKLINDESINHITSYLNMISNYIERFFESQSARQIIIDSLHKAPLNHRSNKARENFRLLKKWKVLVESFKDHEQYVETLLTEQLRLRQVDETESVETRVLKERDCIMKHFCKKEATQSDHEDADEKTDPMAQVSDTASLRTSVTASTIQTGQTTSSNLSGKPSKVFRKVSSQKNYFT